MTILQPPNWMKPKGYVNGIKTRGTIVFIAGQIGWDEQGRFHSDDLVEQSKQALRNVLTVLHEANGKADHIARMTWYIIDRQEYLDSAKALGKVYRELMGAHYPVMTAVEVSALIEQRAKVEIEATAVIPDNK